MNTDYGHAEITVHGESYLLTPSLVNISKIGSPKEIVESFDKLDYKPLPNERVVNYSPWEKRESNNKFVESFEVAVRILNSCGLPKKLTGYATESRAFGGKSICIAKLPIEHVFVLAWHTLKHGVIGDAELPESAKKSKANSFDPHEYIVAAMSTLGLSLSEAEGLTMTKLLKLSGVESKKSEEESRIEESESLLAWFKENNKVN